MGNWIVLLMRNDGSVPPVPFGLFEDPLAAKDWADNDLKMRDDEHYVLSRIRHVV